VKNRPKYAAVVIQDEAIVEFLGRGVRTPSLGQCLLMLIAVVVSVLLAFGTLYLAVVDATRALGILIDYADPSLDSKEATYLRNEAVTVIVRTIDGFLITSILLIFAFAIYELSIGNIDVIDRSEAALRFLAVHNLMN
jgi:uncharacterized membrane protein YqhA